MQWDFGRRLSRYEPPLCDALTNFGDPVAAAAVTRVLDPHVAFEVDDTIGPLQCTRGHPPSAISGVFEKQMCTACCAETARQNIGRLVCGEVAKVRRSIRGWNGNIRGKEAAGDASGNIAVAQIRRKRKRCGWHAECVLVCPAVT